MKTNANKRSEFAKDMQNEWDNFQEKLEGAKNLGLPASLQESVNQSLRKNFENQISKIKGNPEYKEAEKTHKAEILAKVELKKAEKMEKDALIKYEKSKLQTKQKNKEYEQARIDHFGKPTEIKEDNKESVVDVFSSNNGDISQDKTPAKIDQRHIEGDQLEDMEQKTIKELGMGAHAEYNKKTDKDPEVTTVNEYKMQSCFGDNKIKDINQPIYDSDGRTYYWRNGKLCQAAPKKFDVELESGNEYHHRCRAFDRDQYYDIQEFEGESNRHLKSGIWIHGDIHSDLPDKKVKDIFVTVCNRLERLNGEYIKLSEEEEYYKIREQLQTNEAKQYLDDCITYMQKQNRKEFFAKIDEGLKKPTSEILGVIHRLSCVIYKNDFYWNFINPRPVLHNLLESNTGEYVNLSGEDYWDIRKQLQTDEAKKFLDDCEWSIRKGDRKEFFAKIDEGLKKPTSEILGVIHKFDHRLNPHRYSK